MLKQKGEEIIFLPLSVNLNTVNQKSYSLIILKILLFLSEFTFT